MTHGIGSLTWLLLGLMHPPATGTECTCATARIQSGWCPPHHVGYVAGVKIESELLYESLDAPGHEFDRSAMTCDQCRRLIDTGGFCDRCKFGWVKGKAHMSRATYYLAKGQPKDASLVQCSTCKNLVGKSGWCDACNGGWAGNVWLTDRADYEHAATEFAGLLKAVDKLKECEVCAAAMVADGRCPSCKKSYRGGQPVADPAGS